MRGVTKHNFLDRGLFLLGRSLGPRFVELVVGVLVWIRTFEREILHVAVSRVVTDWCLETSLVINTMNENFEVEVASGARNDPSLQESKNSLGTEDASSFGRTEEALFVPKQDGEVENIFESCKRSLAKEHVDVG